MPTPDTDDPLAQPTRARIVEQLAELDRPASTAELARALKLHVNGVRRHLARLRRAGVVERRIAHRERGRPRDEWILVRRIAGTQRSYRDLSRWLARAMPSEPEALDAVEETGRAVGRELAPTRAKRAAAGFAEALAALGFDPRLEPGPGETVRCRLCNCPYAASVRERPDVVCTLHRGITSGLLEAVAPGARLTFWEPHDPDSAGCVALLSGTGWQGLEAGEGGAS